MTDFQWVAIAVVTALSVARISRLVTWDSFPPSIWLRMRWDTITKDGSWSLLAHCGYCFSVWAAFGVVLWGYWCDWNGAWGAVWWIVNGSLAASYVGAIVMSFDGDDGE